MNRFYLLSSGYLLCLLSFCGCTHETKKPDSAPSANPPSRPVSGKQKYHTTKDTVFIYTSYNDTSFYLKSEFNEIVDYFPALTDKYPESPDVMYDRQSSAEVPDAAGNKRAITFGSEQGQDQFYILYAYFLKNKNGITSYADRRQTLIKIYHDINDIFGALQSGGTYFGHQYARIEAYAEYGIHLFADNHDVFIKGYDISKQKNLYIAGLQQLIKDEVGENDDLTTNKEKTEKINELLITVSDLNKLITDNFYLKMAQGFQYEHY